MPGFGKKLIATGLALFAVVIVALAGPARAQGTQSDNAAGPGASAAEKASANIGNPAPAKGPAPRVALVIGNSNYANVTKLANPTNDARAVAELLNAARFEVIAAIDLNRDEMVKVMQDFAARIVERGPDTIALVYYAGHGLQVAGENYLVPIDARINSESEISDNAIRLVDVMATLNSVQSRTRVVILDACRNNPFTALGDAGKGLAIVDAPNGSIVAYSTAPGTEAYDGSGQHSPYTNAFLKLARAPNVPIEQFFKRVRLLVNDVTDGRQTPWESSSLTSDFYLFTDSPEAELKLAEQPREKAKPTYQVADIRKRSTRSAYDIVIEGDSVEYYEEFISVYPNDPLAARIRALLASRLLMVAWHGAVQANTPVAYKSFEQKFASSPYAKSAQKLQVQPKIIPVSTPSRLFVPKRTLPNIQLPPQIKKVNIAPKPFAPVPLAIKNQKIIKLLSDRERAKTITTKRVDPRVTTPRIVQPKVGRPGPVARTKPIFRPKVGQPRKKLILVKPLQKKSTPAPSRSRIGSRVTFR